MKDELKSHLVAFLEVVCSTKFSLLVIFFCLLDETKNQPITFWLNPFWFNSFNQKQINSNTLMHASLLIKNQIFTHTVLSCASSLTFMWLLRNLGFPTGYDMFKLFLIGNWTISNICLNLIQERILTVSNEILWNQE